ncbi:hypothetical protein XCR1_4170021 [Xenorhabdus cabanillasii JM26]|uniref:Uncharacterized protein n=1 Tax=Xenorhabdus cabanillasii JM26 TaxID=1427517 RepID=W1J703_9GAMM|nr:hypothetical protein XCR1_4170021 [Xenorhabdus cabanillasii JM26]
MLAGKGNIVSANMSALENARDRALIVGHSLIILPDQTCYAGDGSGIKAAMKLLSRSINSPIQPAFLLWC